MGKMQNFKTGTAEWGHNINDMPLFTAAFFFFFRARQFMPRMHLSLRLIVQP
jgi:hypothetical protein